MRKLKRRNLILNACAGAAVFAALLVLLSGRRYAAQDALFVTAAAFIIAAMLKIVVWTGFFDLLSYSLTKVVSSLKRDTGETPARPAPFHDYKQSRTHVIKWETAAVGAAFLLAALAAPFFA